MRPEDDEIDDREMSIVDHLIELRGCLLRIIIAMAVIFIIFLPFNHQIYEWFARPVLENLMPGQKMLAHQPVDIFLTPIKVCLFLAFLITVPWTLYQIWRFVAPGMYKHEKRATLPLLVSATALFYLGVVFAYLVILPLMFHYLGSIHLEGVEYMPDITAYLGLTLRIFLAFGVVFEVPVAIVILVNLGIVELQTLTKKRAYVVLIAFTVGMLLTPPDMFSQTLLAIPVIVLFEVGILIAKYSQRKKNRRQQEIVKK